MIPAKPGQNRADTKRAALRRRLRAARRALPVELARRHATDVARRFCASKIALRGRRFAGYVASDGELDPAEIIDRLLDRRRTVALPVVLRSRALCFYRYTPQTRMVQNRFDILEPDTTAGTYIPTTALDVVLVPLVAYDERGHRLGRGGGFYDATFARLSRRPLLVGLAHALQRVARLDAGDWDVPLDAVVTENGVEPFTARGRTAAR